MSLIDNLKKSEDDGFKSGGKVYKDTKGLDTIGYGTLLPLSEKECTLLLENRLKEISEELISKKPIVLDLDKKRYEVIAEMAYQLGVPTLLKFKKMWKAIEMKNYSVAAMEMLDSKWAKLDTPARAKRLAEIMS